jgi:hypothetical protein
VVRYSFLVGLLHSLLHAGLSRRTELAIYRQMSSIQDAGFHQPPHHACRRLSLSGNDCCTLTASKSYRGFRSFPPEAPLAFGRKMIASCSTRPAGVHGTPLRER